MKVLLEYLSDILERIDFIEIIYGKSKQHFEEDRNAQAAVERHLEVIGEIIKRLPLDIKNDYAEIPWRRITGLRDKLAHHYDEIDLEILWSTIGDDLPHLKTVIQQMLTLQSQDDSPD